MVSVFSDPARARLNAGLLTYDAMGGDEKACRRRVRDAEWNFRATKGCLLESGQIPYDPPGLSAHIRRGLPPAAFFAPGPTGRCSSCPARPGWG